MKKGTDNPLALPTELWWVLMSIELVLSQYSNLLWPFHGFWGSVICDVSLALRSIIRLVNYLGSIMPSLVVRRSEMCAPFLTLF